MIDPAGTTSRGTSDGSGTMIFSEPAVSLDFYIRTSSSNSTGQVQIIDTTGAVIEDITSAINSDNWLHIDKQINTGSALMASVIVNAFGSDMLAIDDISFNTEATGDNSADDTNTDDANSDGYLSDDDNGNNDSMSTGSGGGLFLVWPLCLLFLKRKM